MDKSTYIPDAPEVKAETIKPEKMQAYTSKILSEKFADHGFVETESYEAVRYSSRGD